MVSLFEPNADNQKKEEEGNTDNADMIPSACQSILADQSKKGRIKARRNHDADGYFLSATN